MASNPEEQGSDTVDISSDDECLSVLKRKTDEKCKESDKRTKYSGDSEDGIVVHEMFVRVEVEEVEESHFKLEFNNTSQDNAPAASTSRRKSRKSTRPKKKRTFPCPKCDAVFECAPDLRTHALEHQIETRHKCEHCGRCFNKAFSLKMHKRVHLDREMKCPLCELTFTLRINLGRHMTTHERTEECDKCPAKFHTRGQLDDHARTHLSPAACQNSKEKPVNKSSGTKAGEMSKAEVSVLKRIKREVDSENNSTHDVNGNGGYRQDGPNPFLFPHYDGYLKRENLSHPTQCAIVSKMHKGRSVSDICRLYNITPEVVNEIWEEREKYALPKKAGKKTTKYMNSILDARIVEWFNNQRAKEVQVSGKMLQDVAEAFAKDCGFVAFNGSKKWLDRFKKRYNISLRMNPSKRDYHNVALESKWKKQFFKEQWCDARVGFSDDDIYTADEVGLYYNPSKGRIKKLAGKKFIHGYAKDRLAIFMCTNITGTDKKKLLVCGLEDPLVHSYRNPDTLPVTYIRHSQAHFTTHMFEEYVKYWNRQLQVLNRKAILILDRATIHTKLQMSNLRLVFVPWKASTGLIPIKNGIYNRFRDEFRRLFLEVKAMNALRGVDRNMTCLEALNMIKKAWDRTPADIITKSFSSTGYDVQSPSEVKPIEKPKVNDDDEEVLCKLLRDYDVESYFTNLSHLDMYLTVDEELLTGQGTNGSVFGGNHKVTEPVPSNDKDKEEILPISTDKPENEEKEVSIRKTRALLDLEIVRKYLQSTNTSYETYLSFMDVEKFLWNSPISYDS